ncbi:MAG: MFS transporter [Pararheinheimera sp.]|nr:MFS transporter [Rheinheimera sp.]
MKFNMAYSLLPFIIGLMMFSLNVLPGIYAKQYQIPLTVISLVIVIVRLTDIVTDLIVGYLSDRYYTKSGTRLPFIVSGIFLTCLSYWFLFMPQQGVSVSYFATWSILFYLGITLYAIPYAAIAGEQAKDARQRTSLYGYKSTGTYCGIIAFLCIPLLPIFASTSVTIDTMNFSAIIAVCLSVPALFIFLYNFGGARNKKANQDEKHTQPVNIKTVVRDIIGNRPFLIFIVAHISMSLAWGCYAGLGFILMDSYLGIGEYYIYILLAFTLAAFIFSPVAVFLSARFGKKSAFCVSGLFILLTVPLLPFAFSGHYTLPIMFITNILVGAANAIGSVTAQSLVTNISDYGTLKSGSERNASYFSFFGMANKIGYAAGAALSVGLVGWFGFDPASAEHAPNVALGFELALIWLPGVMALISIISMSLVPINERRHDVISRRITRMRARNQIG